MKPIDLRDFLQYLAPYEFEIKLVTVIAASVILVLVVVYFLRQRATRPVVAGEAPKDSPKTPAAERLRQVIPQESLRPAARVDTPKDLPKAPTARIPRHDAPQDSVLRRHHLTHVRYMIETVSQPRPTDSVLRRHHDHLIGSELDCCLNDHARLEKLICRYEQHKSKAVHG